MISPNSAKIRIFEVDASRCDFTLLATACTSSLLFFVLWLDLFKTTENAPADPIELSAFLPPSPFPIVFLYGFFGPPDSSKKVLASSP